MKTWYLFQTQYWMNGDMDAFYFVGEVSADDEHAAVSASPVILKTGCLVVDATTGSTYLSPICDPIGEFSLDQVRLAVAAGPYGFRLTPGGYPGNGTADVSPTARSCGTRATKEGLHVRASK